jgi:undecaprenyl-diphosphatase
MNELIPSLILAVVQGLTEWLPISSSGHLVLFHALLGVKQSLLFDVALHFGTLMAVFVYFGKDVMDIIEAFLRGQFKSENGRLGLLIIVASIPAVVVGLLFKKFFEETIGEMLPLAIGFGITGLTLLIAGLDFYVAEKKVPSFFDAFLIGLAQAFSILPSVSRSGATISVGLLRGIEMQKAMRFSFLMSIPVIFGAGIIEIGNQRLPSELLWATLVSFIVGLCTIHFLIKFVSRSRKNLLYFGIYSLLLALGIGVWLAFF